MFSTNFSLLTLVLGLYAYKIIICDACRPDPTTKLDFVAFSNKTIFRTLGPTFCIFIDALSRSLRHRRSSRPTLRQRLVLLYLASILLSISYAPEPNPGPTHGSSITSCNSLTNPHSHHSSWACGTCDQAVQWGDIGVACERCGQWFHGHCQSIDTLYYQHLGEHQDIPWYCAICGSPNSQTVFDLHGVDWPSSAFTDLSLGSSCTTPTDARFKPQHTSTPTRASQQDKWKNRPLRVININFQSASAKRAEIPNLVDSLKPDIILGTETMLDSSIANAEILPSFYKTYRRDRDRQGGGVLIAVRDNLDSYSAPELEVENCEILWARVKLKGRRTLYLCAFYRPNTADEPSLHGLQESLQRAQQLKNAHLLIGGDFNLPDWDWHTATLKPGCRHPRPHQYFLDIINDCGLEQLVKEPTREGNILDLLLTNCPHLTPRIEVVPGLSDHDHPYCELIVSTQRKRQAQRQIPLYAKADWNSLKVAATDLSCNIQDMKDTATTEQIWETFKTSLTKAVDSHIPCKTARSKVSQPWVTSDIRKLIHKRDRAYKKWKKTGLKELGSELKALRRTVQRTLRRAYWGYLNDIFTEEDTPQQATKNKRFWSFIKNQKSSNVGVAPLRKDGHLTSDPTEQAEILNEQFQSVFGNGQAYTEDEFTQKTGMLDTNFPVMKDIDITEEGVRKLLKSMNPHKAGGPDGISPRVLRELSDELTPALTILFQSSLSTGTVPTDWRTAHVTPIYKKGEQYDPANYRPISLTSVVCKLMEHIVVSSVMKHLETHNILNDYQHGFRRLRSCETQLLELTEELTANLENGKQTDILVLDFSKAFDRVNHSLLLHKIQRYGIRGLAHSWISSFLSDRFQSVVVNGCSSSSIRVKSGVPQGSVLGPCLFLAYINDLPEKLTSRVRLFADDTAMYRTISTGQDQDQLQQDLHRLAEWEKSWDMEFHPAKCQSLPITRSRKPLHRAYTLHGHTLETVTSARYLGVTIQDDMSWDKHISNICTKANRTLGFLRRNLKIGAHSVKERAYKAYVRPLLEYASSVWDPHKLKNIQKIEAVQRRAARYVLNRFHNTSSVSSMLESLDWPSLEMRRETTRLSMLFKVSNGLVHCPSLKAKLVPLPPRQRRGNNKPFTIITTRTNYRAFSFLPRAIKGWNSLPREAVEATSLDTFVSRISK